MSDAPRTAGLSIPIEVHPGVTMQMVYAVEVELLERELNAAKEEIVKLKEFRAKVVLEHLFAICGECDHQQDEDKQCANCLKIQLNTAKEEIKRLSSENKELDRQVTLNRNNWAIDSEEKDRRHYKSHALIRRMREILKYLYHHVPDTILEAEEILKETEGK